MGTLTLPVSGFIYADAQTFIYTVQKHPVYEPILRTLWEHAELGKVTVLTSELSLMEVLVVPLRDKNTSLVNDYRRLLLQSAIQLIPVTRDVLTEAADLRAAFRSLRTPDAIHAATANHCRCNLFLTNDKGIRQVPSLASVILQDLVTP